MNEDILNHARALLAKRRQTAISKADAVEDFLLDQTDFAENERLIGIQTMRCGIAMAKNQNYQKDEKLKNELIEKREKLLIKYGKTKEDLVPKFFCKQCSDTGYVDGKKCSCLKNEITKMLVTDSNIPNPNLRFDRKDMNFDEKTISFIEKFCSKYPDTERKSIVFSGKTGTGKTYLANVIANELMEKQFGVLFLTAFRLNGFFRKQIFSDIDKKDYYDNALIDIDALVIDDLGAEHKQKFDDDYMVSLINERACSNKTTIITTNLDFGDLKERYGERLMSRLSDKNMYYRIELDGDDKRH